MDDPPDSTPPPPPLPVQPIAYASPMPPPIETTNHARALAKASWVAPVIALCLGGLTNPDRDASGGYVIAITNLLLLTCGFVFAVVALTRMRRHGKQGILVPALIGLCINGLFLVAFVGVLALSVSRSARYARMTAPAAAVVPPGGGASVAPATPTTAASTAEPQATVMDFPGWVGVTDRVDVGARVVVFQWDDAATVTQKHKAAFAADCTMLSIVVNNEQGTADLTIDPASLEFHFAAGDPTLKALPPRDILATARFDREQFLSRWGGVLTIPRGGVLANGLAFLPPKADLSSARAVTLTLNGQQIIIPGRYCTPAEKQQLLDRLNGQ